MVTMEIGEMIDWKFGLINRQIERISENDYLIHETSGSWITAKVDKKTLDKLTNGEMSLLELNWE
jgi:hypothetical protein